MNWSKETPKILRWSCNVNENLLCTITKEWSWKQCYDTLSITLPQQKRGKVGAVPSEYTFLPATNFVQILVNIQFVQNLISGNNETFELLHDSGLISRIQQTKLLKYLEDWLCELNQDCLDIFHPIKALH